MSAVYNLLKCINFYNEKYWTIIKSAEFWDIKEMNTTSQLFQKFRGPMQPNDLYSHILYITFLI